MKKQICALILCLSLPLSASLPSAFVMTQSSFAFSSLCSVPISVSSVLYNDKAERAKEELNKALQNITCTSLNCTHLIINDVKALGAMTNVQLNAWVTSILQIIPDVALLSHLAAVSKTLPNSPKIATSLTAAAWSLGLADWGVCFNLTLNAFKGMPSYCTNSCDDYRPFLDAIKFAELQARAEDANSATTKAWGLSIVYVAIRMFSTTIPVFIVFARQILCPSTEEVSPLYESHLERDL